MSSEFREYYENELRLLYEHARDFAAEYPGIADRLGGLDQDVMDPGLKAVMEGAAFMAARVQLKLKSEFGEFTSTLLEQLVPNALAPTPSFALVQAQPAYDNPNLRRGALFATGSNLDAAYIVREQRVSCRYTLGTDLAVWPLHLETAQYLGGTAPIQAMGLDVLPGTASGLALRFRHRTANPEKGHAVRAGDAAINTLGLDTLPIYLVGSPSEIDSIYEQLFARCRRMVVRTEDAVGRVSVYPLRSDALEPLGFDTKFGSAPASHRPFAGFETLRSYFAFPPAFCGFRLRHLREVLQRIETPFFDLVFEFDAAVPRLSSVVTGENFALYAAPAVNLFEMSCDRIPVDGRQSEYPVIADRSRWLDYEVHRALAVFAHYEGRKDKVPVYPLYDMPESAVSLQDALYYDTRRLPRQPTEKERRQGRAVNYAGTETFIALSEPPGRDETSRVRELSVRALVSNRHLTEHLPAGAMAADFHMTNDTSLALRCVAGPTEPRDSTILIDRKQRAATRSGPVLWRLLNVLSFSHLGLTGRGEHDSAAGLQEVLSLFADASDSFTERQIRGIAKVSISPVVKRLRQPTGYNPVRGLGITVTFDEKFYARSGVMVLGAVLDRFFASYTAINSFTQTTIASVQRGTIMKWPPRIGGGSIL